MVHVDRCHTPSPASVPHPRRAGTLLEAVAPPVDVEHVAGTGNVGMEVGGVDRRHVPVEQAVVVEITHGAAHAVGVQAGAGLLRQVGEGAVAIVAEVAAGTVVGGDQQLGETVAVHVDKPRTEPEAGRVIDARRSGHVEECAVPLIAEQQARGGDAAEDGDEQIQIAIEIVVAEDGPQSEHGALIAGIDAGKHVDPGRARQPR